MKLAMHISYDTHHHPRISPVIPTVVTSLRHEVIEIQYSARGQSSALERNFCPAVQMQCKAVHIDCTA